jgi:ATPase subunit of ABC transporter with duplicated ATPase domains
LMSEENRQKEDKLNYLTSGSRLGNSNWVPRVTKAYGDKLLFDNLTFSYLLRGIVGIVGPNGAGKSTLSNLSSRDKCNPVERLK